MVKPLTAEEEALAARLARAGLSARAGRVFAFLARGQAHSAAQIGAVLDLSRQDAGDAARELELHGLARAEDLATGGRPSKRYSLAQGFEDSLRALLDARRKALDDERAALDSLAMRFG